jgi:putative redox protein
MAVEMRIDYSGELHCELEHGPSRKRIETDAPLDNMGKGEAFSPTDLLATMAIRGPKEGIAFGRAQGRVLKSMSSEGPRRIAELQIEIEMPAGLGPEQRVRLEEIAMNCPVALSLGSGVARPMKFRYPD